MDSYTKNTLYSNNASAIFSKKYHKIVIIFKHIVMNVEITFHFACRQWYSYNNPGILT